MKISRYNNNCQIWKLEKETIFELPIKGVECQHAYFILNEQGELKIITGYSWNGCSPKIEIFGMVFGTPEGALPGGEEEKFITTNLRAIGLDHLDWDKPKTYFASLVHDCLYQISAMCVDQMDRRVVDKFFLKILWAYRFFPARLYYLAVRLFGNLFWQKDF